MCSTSAAAISWRSHSSRMPASTPAEGSAGVVGTLWITVTLRSVSDRTRSVKVPPTSTPIIFMLTPPARVSLSGDRERPRADLLGRAAERVPLLDSPPDALARFLGGPADRGQVDAGNDAIAHAHDAVDDDGHDVVADPALHQRLDRVAN